MYICSELKRITMALLKYFNPNPKARVGKDGKPQKWHLGDCAVRAICAATGMSWVDAYRFASESALKVYEPFNLLSWYYSNYNT